MNYKFTAGLSSRHHQIIRLAFTGLKHTEISERIGISQTAISVILASPLAKAELARLRAQTDEQLANIPLRTRLRSDLDSSAKQALSVINSTLNDPMVDIRVRSANSRHILDRHVFGREVDDHDGVTVSYRDIIRAIAQASSPSIVTTNVTVNNEVSPSPSHDPLSVKVEPGVASRARVIDASDPERA